MKKIITTAILGAILATILTGCGEKEPDIFLNPQAANKLRNTMSLGYSESMAKYIVLHNMKKDKKALECYKKADGGMSYKECYALVNN